MSMAISPRGNLIYKKYGNEITVEADDLKTNLEQTSRQMYKEDDIDLCYTFKTSDGLFEWKVSCVQDFGSGYLEINDASMTKSQDNIEIIKDFDFISEEIDDEEY